MDWVNFTSIFRTATPEVVFPWPPLCCRRTGNFVPLNEEGCRLGHMDYLFTKVCPSSLTLRLSVWPSLVLLSLPPSLCLSAPPRPPFFFFSSLSHLSLVFSTLPPSVHPSLSSQGMHTGSGADLTPATFLRLSGTESSSRRNSRTPVKQPTFMEPLLCAWHSSKCFKFLSCFSLTTAS